MQGSRRRRIQNKQQRTSGVGDCIAPDTSNRPVTPEHIKKYRKSYRNEIGKRFIHPKMEDDIKPSEDIRYGIVGEKGINASNVMSYEKQSKLKEYLENQKEWMYQSNQTAPLGKSNMNDINKLPSKYQQDDFRFGQSTKVDKVHAKDIIGGKWYQDDEVDTNKKVRDNRKEYDWNELGVDPKTYTFGQSKEEMTDGRNVERTINKSNLFETKIIPIPSNGVRENNMKLSEDIKQRTFGAPTTAPDKYNAARLLKSHADSEPDNMIGKSKMSINSERYIPKEYRDHVFGMKSGDDKSKPAVLRPISSKRQPGENLYNANPEDFQTPMDKQELREIFDIAGYDMNDNEFDTVMKDARQNGQLTIDNVRHSYNRLILGMNY